MDQGANYTNYTKIIKLLDENKVTYELSDNKIICKCCDNPMHNTTIKITDNILLFEKVKLFINIIRGRDKNINRLFKLISSYLIQYKFVINCVHLFDCEYEVHLLYTITLEPNNRNKTIKDYIINVDDDFFQFMIVKKYDRNNYAIGTASNKNTSLMDVWSGHIENTIYSLSRNFYIFTKIRKYLNEELITISKHKHFHDFIYVFKTNIVLMLTQNCIQINDNGNIIKIDINYDFYNGIFDEIYNTMIKKYPDFITHKFEMKFED